MDRAELTRVLVECADKIAESLSSLSDWGLAGTRAGQYRSDLVADEIGVGILTEAGLSVLSEESGRHEGGPLLAVFDPVDGSTNASQGLPWYATSICVLDEAGPLVALVRNQSSGVTYTASRGEGATRDGRRITPSKATRLDDSIIALASYPRRYLGWRQYRVYGAAALDLCAVADGTFDAYLDCGVQGHGPWDYLGGLLVCLESGAVMAERSGADLIAVGHSDRRGPVAAATTELLSELVGAYQDTEKPSAE